MCHTISNQGRRVKMEIVEFVTTRPHHGRRGSPKIPTGTKLYAIKYDTGGYYTYSYQDKNDAINCIENSKLYKTDTEYYREWNVVKDMEDTMHVSPRK